MHSITSPHHPLQHQKIKMISILVTNKDILPPVPPKHHVVDITRYMYPWLPCHAEKPNMIGPKLRSCKPDPLYLPFCWVNMSRNFRSTSRDVLLT